MSGTASAAQLGAELVGQSAATPAIVAQLGAELVGQSAATPAIVAQLGAELVGQSAATPAIVAQLGMEIIAPLPVLPPKFSRERPFPLGFKNWPPRAGAPWRLAR